MKKSSLSLLLAGFFFHLGSPDTAAQDTVNFPSIGEVMKFDDGLDALIAPDAEIEVLAGGFVWSEGPVWVPEDGNKFGGYVLFSDIPANSVIKWQEGVGSSVFLKPSGYTGFADYGAEPGCNGLLLDPAGQLVSCEHGDRRLSVITAGGGKRTLVDNFEGKRLNSPNDACYHSSGAIYFTDPPYGLPKRWEDPMRELDFCGVYRLAADGALTLLTKEMTRPNGIAFSPDEKTLYVAQSDPEAPVWKSFPVKDDGTLGEGKLFYDSSENLAKNWPGLPDGMKVDSAGNLFATGPGGVYIFTPEAKLLGIIHTGERTANCAWGGDGTVLYLTSDMYLCRIQTKTKGAVHGGPK